MRSARAAASIDDADIAALADAKAKLDGERAEKLATLSDTLAKKRSDAIKARRDAGIDDQWTEDLEFYAGVDDANRHELTAGSSWHTKPPGQAMPAESRSGEVRSTVFVNITRPYVDAAAARIGDMLMPTDDRAFELKPSPVPELANLSQGKLSQTFKKSLLAQHAAINDPQQQRQTVEQAVAQAVQQAQLDVADAKEASERAQTQIDDWFVECQFHAQVRNVIDDCARIGSGVIKGPVPVLRKSKVVQAGDDGKLTLTIQEELAPESRRIDPLNFFPHGACGEDIHSGSYTWERDYISQKTLEDLKGQPDYFGDQIEECIKEGPQKATTDARPPQGRAEDDIKEQYEIWYFHGILKRADFEALGCECDDESENESVYVIVTMVNHRIVKAATNPLDTGEFPYDVMVWQRQPGRWAGVGVSRQIRTPQRIINSATRNMMDNAGIAGGPQIVFKLGVVTPADGQHTITPRKVWYVSADVDVSDLNSVFRTYKIDMVQEELMAIIQFGLKLAEDVTGLPLLLQGQQGKAPDTLGGIQLLTNNAGTTLRRLAKLFDDNLTEPHVRRYYIWIMQYSDDDTLKGDFQIDARGSSALVERDLQNQAVGQMASIVLNPAFGINPRKWYTEFCKSQRLDAKSFTYTDEELKQIQQQAQQGPSDPRLAVAQLRAQLEEKLVSMELQTKQQLLLLEQGFEREQNERERQTKIFIAEIDNASKESVSLQDLKQRLADTAMKLRTQRDLSAQSNAVDLHKHHTPQITTPPTEPAGRAPPGQAFQR